jgi:uncharacterized protein (DUF983 family)
VPYSNPEQAREQKIRWAAEHPDKVKESQKKYHESIKIRKRCPVCRKHREFRKDYLNFCQVIVCKHCGKRLHITKTLSDSNKNAHGVKLEAI